MGNEDCQGCLKRNTCKTPCLYVEIVTKLAGKHKSIRERLGPPDISNINNLEFIEDDTEPTNIDYNSVITERKQARADYTPTTIKKVRSTPETLKKAVAAMLYAELTIAEISEVIDKSERTVRRICHR